MQLHGTHKVNFDSIRSLAIICHALDLSAYHMFVDGTHFDRVGKTQIAYEELCTSQLIALAIALRTKFYQGTDYRSTKNYVSSCALLYKIEGKDERNVDFSIKDICDKIIHANQLYRELEHNIPKPTTSLTYIWQTKMGTGNIY